MCFKQKHQQMRFPCLLQTCTSEQNTIRIHAHTYIHEINALYQFVQYCIEILFVNFVTGL